MCRLAAFPPMFTQKAAYEVMIDFAGCNKDGVGSAYVDLAGQIQINKWGCDLEKVIKDSLPLFDHMPHPGWTIAHLRQATHGKVCKRNTHPFQRGKWAVAHNGVWSDYLLAKTAMHDAKLAGDTDSEVAAELINRVGPKRFWEVVRYGGVFLALNTNGELWVSKRAGELHVCRTKNGLLLGSTLPKVFEGESVDEGWYQFDKTGWDKNFHVDKTYSGYNSWRSNSSYEGYNTSPAYSERSAGGNPTKRVIFGPDGQVERSWGAEDVEDREDLEDSVAETIAKEEGHKVLVNPDLFKEE